MTELLKTKARTTIIENMLTLGIPTECITQFQYTNTIHLINGRTAIPVNTNTFPALYQFISTLQSEKNLLVYAVFNEPTLYGEATDMYTLLCVRTTLPEDEQFKICKKGALCKTTAYTLRASDWIAEQSLSCFQMGDGGVWCLPHIISNIVKF